MTRVEVAAQALLDCLAPLRGHVFRGPTGAACNELEEALRASRLSLGLTNSGGTPSPDRPLGARVLPTPRPAADLEPGDCRDTMIGLGSGR